MRIRFLFVPFVLAAAGGTPVHTGAPPAMAVAGPIWFDEYQNGLRLMRGQKWEEAAFAFLRAISDKERDNPKERVSGVRTMEYMPHRELGICLLELGIRDYAAVELDLSMQQSWTERASSYKRRLQD